MKIKLCLVMLLVLMVLPSCTQKQIQNKCEIKDMLLDKMDFPKGTLTDDPSSPVAEYPTESAGVTASFRNDLLYQVVGQYSSVKSAERKFTENLQYYFNRNGFDDSWKRPIELSHESPFAQKYHVACGNLSQGYQCRMIGQYNEYYVFFFAYISDDGMTLKSFENLLMKIDDRMAACIRK